MRKPVKVLNHFFFNFSPDIRQKGFTVLLLAENEADYKMLEVLDRSVCLIGNCVKIQRFLVWSPGIKKDQDSRTLASQVEVSSRISSTK